MKNKSYTTIETILDNKQYVLSKFVSIVVLFISLEIYNRNSRTAKLHMLVLAVRNVRHRLQVLTDELAQNAVALAMQNAHTRHSYKYSVVDEVLHSVQSFVATHATHVEILMEVELM